jgi:competence protein ComEA
MACAAGLMFGSLAVAEKQEGGEKININEAAVTTLAKLPGVGRKKAEAIVAYRNEHGKFNAVDDLKKVDGIGKKTLEKLRGHVTVEGS